MPGLVRADARGDGQVGGRVAVAERGVQLEVAQVHGRGGVEVDRAEDPAQPDHVLVLQPVAVRVPVDLDGDLVPARLEVLRDVVLGRVVRVLVVADEFAVDPHVVGRLDALEVQEGTAVTGRPVLGEVEGAPVLADGVVAGRRVRRLRLLAEAVRAPPRVGDVDVDGEVVAVQLPVGRDRDAVPAAVVDVRPVEVLVPVARPVDVRELPRAVEAQPVRGAGAVAGEGLSDVRVRHEGGVGRFRADLEERHVAGPLGGAVGLRPPAWGPVGVAAGEGQGAEEGGAALQQSTAAYGVRVRVVHDRGLPRDDMGGMY